MCDYAVLVDRAGQGVPRRPAAGQDGHRRGRRRRGARRRRDAHPGVRASATTSPSTSSTRSASAARSWPGSTGASSARRRAPRPSPRYDPEEILGIAAGRPQGAVRPPRGAGPHRRRLRVRRVQAALRHRRWSPAGRGCTAIRSACSPTTAACCSARRPRRPPSSSCWPTRPTPRWSSCRTPPATWSAPSYEQGGIIKDGAKMINAVTNSAVPHLTINMASSFGAGNYGMSGRAYDPRFMFAWPGAKLAVMGAAQLAGVLSIVGRASAAAQDRPFDEDADRARTAADRGADRDRVARVLRHRPALRRRHHRPPRHPHRARHRAVGRPLADRRRAARLRRLPDVRHDASTQAAGGQPRGDRRPRLPHRPRAGHRHRRGVLRRRRRRCPTSRSPTRPSGCPAPRPPTPTCAATCSSRPPAPPAPTPSTPATGSSRRTPGSPATARRPG